MLFPYKDDNPRVLFPTITYTIIGINIFVYLLQFHFVGNNPQMAKDIIYRFGFIPNDFNVLDIITSMFMHGGFGHIIGNMWFLYIFGDNVESILGHARYFSFYIFCGIGAALGQFFIEPTSTTPMVGASGAIAGILGAYMIKFPKVLGIWFIMQLSGGLNSLGINTTGGIAWFAHIGGFLVGVVSLKIFQTFHFKHNE